MNAHLYAWALFIAAVAGVCLAAGALTRHARNMAVVALALFTVAGVLTLVANLD